MLNRAISTPIAIIIILILVALVGSFTWLQYGKMWGETSELPEIELPEKEEVTEEPKKETEEICFNGELVFLSYSSLKEIKDESLNQFIIKSIIEDNKQNNYVLEENFCNARILEANGREIDLNKDGFLEYIIQPDNIETNNKPHGFGGTGGGPIYIFGFIQEKWKLIGSLVGLWENQIVKVETKQTNGYANLLTRVPMGTGSREINEYIWNGEKYELKFFNFISPAKDEKWKIGELHTIQWESSLVPSSYYSFIELQKYLVGKFSGGVAFSPVGYIARISNNNPIIWNADKVWPRYFINEEEDAKKVEPGTYRIRIQIHDKYNNIVERYSELFQIE